MKSQTISCIVSIILLLTILLVGCLTSPEKNTSGEVSSDTSYYVSKVKIPPAFRTDTILISEMKFQPQELKVKKGDTVVWLNNDMVPHCVTEVNTSAWTSLSIASGASWKMVAAQSSDYYCAIHKVMKGRITVKE